MGGLHLREEEGLIESQIIKEDLKMRPKGGQKSAWPSVENTGTLREACAEFRLNRNAGGNVEQRDNHHETGSHLVTRARHSVR